MKQFDERTKLRFERIAKAAGDYCTENNKQIDLRDMELIAEFLQQEIMSDNQILEFVIKSARKKQ